MAKDFYDARDEHDIAELRRAMRSDGQPKLVGSRKPHASRGCVAVLVVCLAAPIFAAVVAVKDWG